jgi:LytS/YehU family sensor histidine kinase
MAAVLGNIGNAYFATTQDSNGIIKPDSLIPAGKNTRLLKSIAYLKKGVSMSKDVGDLDGVSVYSLGLVKAYKTLGDYKAALESYELYTASKDSVFSSDNNIKIANLETKRELELKDKQILLDKLEIKKKQNERIFFISVILLLLAVIAIVFRNLKLSVAKELSENKLNAFQARMNPHFIFNALNSIQSLMLQNETLLSIKYLSGFSKLMRQILDNSSKSRVLIDTEMEMLRTYIELEQLRFNCFAWKVDIAGNTAKNNLYVPPMIIQPFVENAIVHGILPKGKDGMLTISLERDNGHILCIVEDNGIGRQRSYELNREKHKGHESHGIDIATKRLTLLKGKKNGAGNSVIYVDKIENNIATGTKVIIQIPIL